ncbi:MAG: hypothetical protein J6S85_16005 [Methanobrevibacter sp.]|nr:hypothetical protein [Methanobrevibacter sp.]
MPEEEGKVVDDTQQDYIDEINKLKETTVPKEQYEKLKADNKKLLESLIKGEQLSVPPQEKPNIEEMRKKLLNPGKELTNLEYIENVIALREAILEEGGHDPFVATPTRGYTPPKESYDAAEQAALLLKHCIEYADGDSSLFTSELQRHLVDPAGIPRPVNRK